MKTNKNIIIAGVIVIGLYIFSHMKKILPMTHPSEWRDMTSAQRAAYTRRTTLTTMAEKIKALKEAIKRKSADENTPLGETVLTSEEQEAILLALEAEKEKRKQTEARKAYKDAFRKSIKPKDQQGYSKKKTQEEIYKDLGLWALPEPEVEHVQEPEEEPKKQEKTSKKKTTEHIVKDYLEQQKKSKDQQGYSKKKTTEDVLKDLGLWALS